MKEQVVKISLEEALYIRSLLNNTVKTPILILNSIEAQLKEIQKEEEVKKESN